jgi:hypothetical protein
MSGCTSENTGLLSPDFGVSSFLNLYTFTSTLSRFIAVIIASVRLSAYILLTEVIAQIAAGNQPMIVICKIRQTMPDPIFP